MDSPLVQRMALPGVSALVAFLAYTSQWLFQHIEPGPLTKREAYIFNGLVACIFICYWRTCLTDPGHIPQDWHDTIKEAGSEAQQTASKAAAQSNRWCRRCEAFKPPRAHHCKTCKRCIMKMDHHCVWTANCVSHKTIPHFIRFLVYAVASMAYLEYFLLVRVAPIWGKRSLPSYLGPSVLQLSHIFVLCAVNSFVLFALTLLLGRTLWSLAVNTWTIEGWEIERHDAVLRRARVLGGYLEDPQGNKVLIEHQEFPWDIGIWANICQGMGSRNSLAWLWPLSRSPSVQSGLSYKHNEIDDPSKPWPPPDPDRLFRVERKPFVGDGFTKSWDVDDFKKRQAADLARYTDGDGEYIVRRRPFHERLDSQKQNGSAYDDEVAIEADEDDEEEDERDRSATRPDEGEEAWRNREGERLADFGVDEEADFYDEDDVPLAELIRRRQVGNSS
ncbi:putative palmitoyltransferase, DHHC domain, palmitoyltransferase PFA4 [Septoria linicola]|nr:putative palmitoyltransferase, DHHC domain, palmitoyltransferase PFA4 [Septoria linicola]